MAASKRDEQLRPAPMNTLSRPTDSRFSGPADSTLATARWVAQHNSRYRRYLRHRDWDAIVARLIAGQSPWKVAWWIQARVPADDELFGMNAVSADALGKRLQRFRAKLPKNLFLPPSLIDGLLGDLEIDVDVLTELHSLLVYQKQRLDLLVVQERDMGFPIEQQRRELTLLLEILTRIRDTQIAMGVQPEGIGEPVHIGMDQPYRTAEESPLEQWMANHPEYVGRMLPLLKGLDDIMREAAALDGLESS
ncbi:MAG: hypothetical protein ABIW50_03350 [Candidatus Limnocylindria bacterium]